MAVTKAAKTMLIKPKLLHIDHHLYHRRQRAGSSEAVLLHLMRRHRLQRTSEAQQRRMNLPAVITTGPGRVWQQTAGNRLIYQDAEAPQKLLHVIPEDTDNDGETCASYQQSLHPTVNHTRTSPHHHFHALRRPTSLPYMRYSLPVDPTLLSAPAAQIPRYLVRPRFPIDVTVNH